MNQATNHYHDLHFKNVYDDARKEGKSHEDAQKIAADAVNFMRATTATTPPAAVDTPAPPAPASKGKK